jgi:thiosulfate/3-mercaptopyruvate sulfurtransferase
MSCTHIPVTTALRILFFAVCASLLPAAPAGCGGHGNRATMLVTTAWLADHLRDPNLVILAVGQKGDYDASHIPGALYLPYEDIHTMAPLTLELPPMPQLTEVFGKLGVANDSHVILYTLKDSVSVTSRAYLTLDAMGLGPHASILDGGFPAWQSEGRAVTAEVRAASPRKLEACPQSDVIVDIDYVSANLHHAGVDIVDARLPEYYSGAKIPNGKRAGHIPGAANLAYSSLVDEQGKLKPVETLRQQFREAGVKPGDRVVSYCHIGQQATLVYFAARYLGFDARLYDGSWEDWSAHKELPAEVGGK